MMPSKTDDSKRLIEQMPPNKHLHKTKWDCLVCNTKDIPYSEWYSHRCELK